MVWIVHLIITGYGWPDWDGGCKMEFIDKKVAVLTLAQTTELGRKGLAKMAQKHIDKLNNDSDYSEDWTFDNWELREPNKA